MNSALQPVQPRAVAVRPATTDDLEALAPLFDAYRQFYGQRSDVTVAHRFLSERLARSESHVLIATTPTDGATIAAGFAQLYPTFSSIRCRRTLVLNDLYVAPDHRQEGVAWALLDHTRQLAALLGAASVSLQTAPSNVRARSLSERFGFVQDDAFQSYLLPLS
jgi:ribosomal protein S18 acetylase RimI-like enzyme